MPWLPVSSKNQHPWYLQFKIGSSLSYMRKDLNYLTSRLLGGVIWIVDTFDVSVENLGLRVSQ